MAKHSELNGSEYSKFYPFLISSNT